ncbi:flagellar basal body-associated FliL family protein [Niveibacterium umoris]|uniref:Flagellar protein FliL n=1 Tax=Niveibacterium umoris TaxID=1193620 RepID=A0A840BKV2_9RHOO|nr:flagellar basal body-associated protein FliL [Niveibacterium umoris]MBB4011147.1 flagellar FliL protein [Niveibacterium umoris]
MSSKPAKPAAEGEAAPKKSKKMLVIIVVAALVVAIAAGGAFFLLSKKKKAAAEGEEEAAAEEKPAAHAVDPKAPPVFVPLEPFVVNLQPENGEQYLQVVLSFRVADAHTGDQIKALMPEIRHRILMLLSGKKASEIANPEGREALAGEIREEANTSLGYEKPKKKKKGGDEGEGGPIVAVLFTSFIVQ